MYVFKLLSPIQKVAETDDELKIAGYASTADTDRVGDVIVPDAWTKGGLENFKKNPIILFNHNYSMPVGKANSLEVDSNGLKIECTISKSAGNTYGLIKDGVLSTFSVGFMIKDADYNQTTDGYIIRDAELLEVSVVSVPCNQAATFSVSKSLKTPEDVEKFKKELNIEGQQLGDGETNVETNTDESSAPPPHENVVETLKMDEEAVQALAQKIANEAIKKQQEEAAKAVAEKAAKEAEEARIKTAAEAAIKSTEERLLADFQKKLDENKGEYEKTIGEFKTALEEKSEEFKKMRDSKYQFSDLGKKGADLSKDTQFMKDAKGAFLLSKIKGVKLEDTKIGKEVSEKFNTHSTVTVGNDNLELTVSTQIERDIWNDLILAPLFPEIQMNSAQMVVPIMPDAGYAEITSNTTASGTQPNGNMDPRGAGYGAPYQGITLSEMTLSTIKMISKSYLGNETEEDALIPVLPLIQESMNRAHARGVENLMLAGNSPDGVYTSGAVNGLLQLASTGGRTVTTASASTKLTSATLFGMRKVMGKYGLRPDDVVYIVNQQAYFELIEDPEFADADLVGSQANKLTGEVGRLYGSNVLMCDEFAAAGAGKYFALALNRRNFLVPRLRGITVESDYQVAEQRKVMVTSQRLGFAEKIPGATSVVGLKYGS